MLSAEDLSRLCDSLFLISSKVIADRFGLHPGNNGRESGCVCLFYGLQAAEVFEETARGALAYTGNLS